MVAAQRPLSQPAEKQWLLDKTLFLAIDAPAKSQYGNCRLAVTRAGAVESLSDAPYYERGPSAMTARFTRQTLQYTMSLSRRTFFQYLASTAGAAALSSSATSLVAEPLSLQSTANSEIASAKLSFSAPLTHSDWMLKPGLQWGPEGVHHMLDACKACGWSRVHWRVLDGGRALYSSKIVRPSFKVEPDSSIWDPQTDAEKAIYQKFFGNVSEARRREILAGQQRFDYATFDSFAEAVRYGHQIGLKIDAWVTINEDDHGWGIISDFAKAHPQFAWVKRDGTPYHSQMSFAFPEVRAYKLSIIDELLSNYDLDGLFMDWIRTGDIRDNPQTDSEGIANSGYEAPNVEAFKGETNADPHDVPNKDERWVRVRANSHTTFMRSVRDRVAQHHKPLLVAVMVGHPWHYRGLQDPIDGNLRGLLLDVRTWAEEKLVDAAIAAGYYRAGGDATKAYQALADETQNKIDVWYYAWVPNTSEEFARDFSAAKNLGAKNVLFWEADYIDDRPNAPALKQLMSSHK